MSVEFIDKVRDRAYFKHLENKRRNLPDNPYRNWINAEIEQLIEDKKENEAYQHYLKYGGNQDDNWKFADYTIKERIKFLAFNIHEKKYGKKADEIWEEAENIYAKNF